MITDWADLVGRTPIEVVPFTLGGYILYFEDGECAHIDGDGEEVHGTHWPILSDEYEHFIKSLEEAQKKLTSIPIIGGPRDPD